MHNADDEVPPLPPTLAAALEAFGRAAVPEGLRERIRASLTLVDRLPLSVRTKRTPRTRKNFRQRS